MALKLRLTNFHHAGYSYAMFCWGLFSIYCIGYQLNRVYVYWVRRQRIHDKDAYVKPLPWVGLMKPLERVVKIPFVTELIPVKHILGVSFFTIINLIWIIFAPFKFDPSYTSFEMPRVGLMDRRAAFIANVNWGFVFILGSRNNIVTHMSGLSFEELVPFHRWLARIGLAEYITHFVYRMMRGYLASYVVADTFFYDLEYTTGSIAMFGFLLIFITSIEYVRRNHFEIFYYSHIIGIIVAMIFTCWHEVMCFVYFMPPILLWLADRAWRSYQSWGIKATPIKIDQAVPQTASQEGITRVVFEHKDLKHYHPGQYVFVALAKKGYKHLWQMANWHPMTISEVFRVKTVDSGSSNGAIEERVIDTVISSDKEKVKYHDGALSANAAETGSLCEMRRRAPASASAHQGETTVATLHIKGLGAYTRELLKDASTNTPLHFKVDGPYGPRLEFQDYKVMSCFAAGIGITPALTLIKDCIERRSAGVKTVSTEQIYLVWVIRVTDELVPFQQLIDYFIEKCKSAVMPIKLDVALYVTRTKSGDNLLEGREGCQMIYGRRPDIGDHMQNIRNQHGKDRVWVHVCGSDLFMRTVLNGAVKHGWDAHHETFEF
ncbi:ferric/cupric-chelate reductase [Apophysomyces ossiformis]|uniref:Ferric/cupric-chelate reductase n=1 Tax=Apophysomyces ossiformis TaxID=679940 RepID=A0A8H7ESG9_9FUNG|nr:ferric/cupric-chelate reductase [Apophysomyces ossiformis]